MSQLSIIGFLVFLLAACSGSNLRNPYERYDAVKDSTTEIAFDDAQAIENSEILYLQQGVPLKTSITPHDPRIQTNNILSNYKVVTFHGKKHSQYTIELRSLCDCWGLDKFILYPVARILDKQGNVINAEPTNIVLRNPDWSYPVNIFMVWHGEFEKDVTYYFLISAYNYNTGTANLTFTEYNILASQHKFPLWSSPSGEIVINLTIKPE